MAMIRSTFPRSRDTRNFDRASVGYDESLRSYYLGVTGYDGRMRWSASGYFTRRDLEKLHKAIGAVLAEPEAPPADEGATS